MKLQKRFLRKIGDKEYYKFMINIPPDKIKESRFKEGDELKAEATKDKIILRKKI